MAKNDNLKDFLTDVADAIREKKGTEDLINPQNFSEEIRNLQSGEGGGSASSWKYFDMSMELPNKGMLIAYFAMLAKIDNQITTGASLVIAGEEAFSQVKAIAVDLSKNITSPANGEIISLENFLSTTGIAFTEITEEEFYKFEE